MRHMHIAFSFAEFYELFFMQPIGAKPYLKFG